VAEKSTGLAARMIARAQPVFLICYWLCLVQGKEGSNASQAYVETDSLEESFHIDEEVQGVRLGDHDSAMAHLEAVRSVVNEMVRIQTGNEDACGVTAVKENDEPWKEAKSMKAQCSVLMSHNCTMSYVQLICPEECPFMATDKHFPCQFSCQPAMKCAESNADLPFSDTSKNLCAECEISGCRWCKSRTECGLCYNSYDLSEDAASCHFIAERGGWASYVVYVLYVLIAILIIVGIIYYNTKPWSPDQEHNQNCIIAGRRHRHLAKVHLWDMASQLYPMRWPSLAVDLNEENVIGVGMPLFYNSIWFTFCIALAGLAVSWTVYTVIDVETIIAVTKTNEMSMDMAIAGVDASKHRQAIYPAVVVTPLEHCAERSPFSIHDLLESFAVTNSWAMLCFWLGLFLFSLYYARAQRRYSRWFDSRHISMSDFVLSFSGLPDDFTDEIEIKEWVSSELKRLFPADIDKLEVEGVSVAYNYSEKEDEVNEMLERLYSLLEVDRVTDDDQSRDQEKKTLTEVCKADREKVNTWFTGSEAVKGTGEVFIVFKSSAAKDTVWSSVLKNRELFTHAKTGKTVEVSDVKSEPPDVFWQYLHLSRTEIRDRAVKTISRVFLLFVGINLLVSLPWNLFVTVPVSKAGSSAGADISMINGIIMAIMNGIIGGNIWGGAYGVGFHRKDKLDTFIFIVNMVFSLCNTSINLFLTAIATWRSKVSEESLFDDISECESIGTESEIVQNVYLMMVPGQLVTNTLMGIVNGAVIPFILNGLWQKILYIWACLPTPGLQLIRVILPWSPASITRYERFNAERAVMSGEIGLHCDYCFIITNLFILFSMLGMFSPYNWQALQALCLWCPFYWFVCRYIHLRVCSASYYSTNSLDWIVFFFWGIPLSLVAAAAAMWFVRAGMVLPGTDVNLKKLFVFGMFVLAYALWVMAFLLVSPVERSREVSEEDKIGTFEECKNRWIFTWFNCNPMFTLKCKYFIKDASGATTAKWKDKHPLASGEDPDNVRYFRTGKEYFFLSEVQQEKVEETFRDRSEVETWLENLLMLFSVGKKEVYRMRLKFGGLTESKSGNYISVDESAGAAESRSLLKK